MPPYQNKPAFLADGLEPYANTKPDHTSQPLTSGPLFQTADVESATTPKPEPEVNPRSTTPNTPPSTLSTEEPLPKCPVCLDYLTTTPPSVRIRSCRHTYHEACLSLWLDSQTTCPACRAVLYEAAAPPMISRVLREDHAAYMLQDSQGVEDAAAMPGAPPYAPALRRAGRYEAGMGPWDAQEGVWGMRRERRRRGGRGSRWDRTSSASEDEGRGGRGRRMGGRRRARGFGVAG